MGINLVLPFGEGDETEYVEMTIHPDRTITFPLYDIEHDEMCVDLLGEKPSPVYEFYKGYGGFSSIGLKRFARTSYRTSLAEILVEAIQEQGLGGFSEEEYTKFLKDCLQNEFRFGFEPLDMLKNRLSKEEYIKLLKELVADEGIQGRLSFDPEDLLLEEIDEDEFKKWLIEEIIKDIKETDEYKNQRMRYYSSNAGYLAKYLKNYIDIEDEEEFLIDETGLDFYNTGEVYDMWRNVVGKEYCLWLFNTKVTCWRKVVETEILDPISFNSNTEEWEPEAMGPEYLMSDTLQSVLYNLDVEEPELDDPEPPDHPEPDEDGDYAVAYLLKSENGIFMKTQWAIVPYQSENDAGLAVELSDSIMDKDGDRESFDIYILKKKDKPNKHAEKQMKNETPFWEDVEEGKEWDNIIWTKVYDVLEKI
jgi:hypothetical protein